jgi:hypothetical protein
MFSLRSWSPSWPSSSFSFLKTCRIGRGNVAGIRS